MNSVTELRPTLFEVAGGTLGLLALASAHHVRCLADPELNHPFSHPENNPAHIERLATYLAEVLGGPADFSPTMGDEAVVLRMHAGNGDTTDLGQRFLVCFEQAMDDAGLSDDPEFRSAMTDYMRWAVAQMIGHPDTPDTVPSDTRIPRWTWDGLAV